MNPSAIYSKSGKGVQEAAGKTSHLSRPDRAVLSAIDGRATLADVAQKVGKSFDPAFEKLIESLDRGGFIRQVTPGTPAPAPRPGAKPAAKPAPTAPMDAASDLDFTTALSMPKGKAPPPPSATEKAQAEKVAKEQQDAFAKAREEAERKAQAERDRLKAEAEAKMRAETEASLRAETAAKLKAEAEAKIKAAAEAKAKAEAEAKKAREEAERIRKEAEEKAERARQEAEEKARREQEELKRKLEEERKAREEAERRAEEKARRLEEERKKLEEARRREEQERERAQIAIAKAREKAREKTAEPAAARPAASGGFSDSLLADLESFTNRDEEERREKEEAERKEKEAAAARAREAEARRAKEEGERQEREAKEQRKRDEAERKANEEAELREREEREKERLREEEEKRKREAEEREKKAKQEERLAAKATRGPEFDAAQLRSRRREREMAAKPRTAGAAARAERKGWGKPIAITLFLLLVVAVGVAHVMPIDTADYERAATDALGRPVRIASANLSLVTGLQLKLSGVAVGDDINIAEVRAYPQIDALLGPKKAFNRIEVDGMKVDQRALGEALFAKVKADNFSVAKLVGKQLELVGPLAMPKGLDVEISYDGEGAVRSAVVRGPEALIAKLIPKGSSTELDMSASSFTLPFAPEITLASFSMKGTATPQGLSVSEWDGALLNGTLSGTANVRWGDTWVVDGVVTARSINAAVFAPALLSEGKGEGSGKFTMRGQPGKLASSSRLDGSFTVSRGVLGSIDLSRAIQTGGKQVTGRTQFSEMNGQGVYDRGAVSLRNVTIGAGALNAGASADIAQNGALSGRIVADVRVASQTLRATLNLGGTVKEPQVRH
jgi:hypothetical protein